MRWTVKTTAKLLATILPLLFLLTSCAGISNNLGREAVSTEILAITDTEEPSVWQTGDLAVHYTLKDHGQSFTLQGHVEISNSIRYSFPRVKHFTLHIYLLDNQGTAISRYSTRPRMSTYNIFPKQSKFNITVAKDQKTAAFAFGYFGGFLDSENDFFGGRLGGVTSTDWIISHVPFKPEE